MTIDCTSVNIWQVLTNKGQWYGFAPVKQQNQDSKTQSLIQITYYLNIATNRICTYVKEREKETTCTCKNHLSNKVFLNLKLLLVLMEVMSKHCFLLALTVTCSCISIWKMTLNEMINGDHVSDKRFKNANKHLSQAISTRNPSFLYKLSVACWFLTPSQPWRLYQGDWLMSTIKSAVSSGQNAWGEKLRLDCTTPCGNPPWIQVFHIYHSHTISFSLCCWCDRHQGYTEIS